MPTGSFKPPWKIFRDQQRRSWWLCGPSLLRRIMCSDTVGGRFHRCSGCYLPLHKCPSFALLAEWRLSRKGGGEVSHYAHLVCLISTPFIKSVCFRSGCSCRCASLRTRVSYRFPLLSVVEAGTAHLKVGEVRAPLEIH